MHRHGARNQKIVEQGRNLRLPKINIGVKIGEEKLSGHGDNKPFNGSHKRLVRRLILR